MEQRPKKLLDHVCDAIRLKHDSRHTEEAYVTWITRDMCFHDKRHPKDMGAAEIAEFLTHLAVQQKVAASTQNQALSALLFLYRDVLRQPLGRPIEAIQARKPTRVRTVLTTADALQVMGPSPLPMREWSPDSTARPCDEWLVCSEARQTLISPNGRSSCGMAKAWRIG
jgi:site-specific recombinase XerD